MDRDRVYQFFVLLMPITEFVNILIKFVRFLQLNAINNVNEVSERENSKINGNCSTKGATFDIGFFLKNWH